MTPEQVLARVARWIGAVALAAILGLVGLGIGLVGAFAANGFYDDAPGSGDRWWGDLCFIVFPLAMLALASAVLARTAGIRFRWGPLGALTSWASVVGLFWLSA